MVQLDGKKSAIEIIETVVKAGCSRRRSTTYLLSSQSLSYYSAIGGDALASDATRLVLTTSHSVDRQTSGGDYYATVSASPSQRAIVSWPIIALQFNFE